MCTCGRTRLWLLHSHTPNDVTASARKAWRTRPLPSLCRRSRPVREARPSPKHANLADPLPRLESASPTKPLDSPRARLDCTLFIAHVHARSYPLLTGPPVQQPVPVAPVPSTGCQYWQSLPRTIPYPARPLRHPHTLAEIHLSPSISTLSSSLGFPHFAHHRL